MPSHEIIRQLVSPMIDIVPKRRCTKTYVSTVYGMSSKRTDLQALFLSEKSELSFIKPSNFGLLQGDGVMCPLVARPAARCGVIFRSISFHTDLEKGLSKRMETF